MSRRTAQRRTRKICRTLRGFVADGSEKVDELAKAGAMLDEGFMAEARAKTVQQEREEVYAALQYAASFHCLLEEWKDCAELKPKPKEQWIFVDQKWRRRSIDRSGVLKRKVSMYEMWKRQQAHEDAIEMHRTEDFV